MANAASTTWGRENPNPSVGGTSRNPIAEASGMPVGYGLMTGPTDGLTTRPPRSPAVGVVSAARVPMWSAARRITRPSRVRASASFWWRVSHSTSPALR